MASLIMPLAAASPELFLRQIATGALATPDLAWDSEAREPENPLLRVRRASFRMERSRNFTIACIHDGGRRIRLPRWEVEVSMLREVAMWLRSTFTTILASRPGRRRG